MEFYHGDCLVEMEKIADGSVDMILADLPYGTTACKWDVVIPFEPLWKHYWRVLKPNGAVVLFGSEPFSSHLRMSQIKNYKYDWVWEKTRPGDIFNAKNKPLKSHELICIFSNGTTANCSAKKMPYFPQGVGLGGVKTNNPGESEYAFKGKGRHLRKTTSHVGAIILEALLDSAMVIMDLYTPLKNPLHFWNTSSRRTQTREKRCSTTVWVLVQLELRASIPGGTLLGLSGTARISISRARESRTAKQPWWQRDEHSSACRSHPRTPQSPHTPACLAL